MARKRKKNLTRAVIGLLVTGVLFVTGYYHFEIYSEDQQTESYLLETIPSYQEKPYVVINQNIPAFSESDYTKGVFEEYSKLDSLGRCGVAFANICNEIMPSEEEERGTIGMIKPSGWQTVRYNGVVEGNYLYNRCHLIGWQLAGENANKQNLITGTRYMNVEGMLPFENQVADYLKEKKENHVLYRVTPIFEGNNLVASGVQMEAYSIEDEGKGICFNVYVYNVQPRHNNRLCYWKKSVNSIKRRIT